MRKKSPQIGTLMTRLPEEIDHHDKVSDALRLMTEHGIHHLPVMAGAHLYGVVSSRDLELISASKRQDDKLEVGAVCVREPFTVSPTTALKEVAAQMLERNVGSAVVVDAAMVVGIFTANDALRALVEAYGS